MVSDDCIKNGISKISHSEHDKDATLRVIGMLITKNQTPKLQNQQITLTDKLNYMVAKERWKKLVSSGAK